MWQIFDQNFERNQISAEIKSLLNEKRQKWFHLSHFGIIFFVLNLTMFFRYEQPWCIFSAMILVLDKYEVFRSLYSEKSILNSFHLKKDLRIEKVNFTKSLDHLSCCWLNIVPVQTDSHMVKRAWYNMKIHPFSGKFFRNISK